ncbi:hypothetical protein A0H81_03745 [Grifola frondosa]|uniref:Uncharacterized protein n=1 Tax=Grifola frondosa TaxID=5627 RepID=A0A1C7MHV9_GRIFR|nr:hypothetical protein A0H81_03745 [Grifola frondosa]
MVLARHFPSCGSSPEAQRGLGGSSRCVMIPIGNRPNSTTWPKAETRTMFTPGLSLPTCWWRIIERSRNPSKAIFGKLLGTRSDPWGLSVSRKLVQL